MNLSRNIISEITSAISRGVARGSSGGGPVIPTYAIVDRDGTPIVDRDGNYIIADPTPRTS